MKLIRSPCPQKWPSKVKTRDIIVIKAFTLPSLSRHTAKLNLPSPLEDKMVPFSRRSYKITECMRESAYMYYPACSSNCIKCGRCFFEKVHIHFGIVLTFSPCLISTRPYFMCNVQSSFRLLSRVNTAS